MLESPQLTIYLDLDGVSCRFVESAFRVHGREFDANLWPPGVYDIATVLGMHKDQFWRVINPRGAAFWRELEEYPWFTHLHNALAGLGRVYFVSAPSPSPASAAGKILWLKDRFGEDFCDYLLTSKKHLLSRRGTLLIDDCDAVAADFSKGQGRSVLCPQMWNRNYHMAGQDRLEYLLNEVFNYIAELDNE